jgi:hypothetical protein
MPIELLLHFGLRNRYARLDSFTLLFHVLSDVREKFYSKQPSKPFSETMSVFCGSKSWFVCNRKLRPAKSAISPIRF